MKILKLCVPIIAGVVVSTAFSARADLLAYEPFSGPENTLVIGSSGGFGFADSWNTNNNAQTESPGGTATAFFVPWDLGYVDSFGSVLQTSSGAAFFQGSTINNFSWQGVRAFDFTRGTNDSLNLSVTYSTWISMLIVRTGPENAGANPYARGVNVVQDMTFGQTPPAGQLQKIGIGNGSGAAANTVAILSSGGSLRPSANPEYQFGGTGGALITNLVILEIQHVAGGLDNANLWVNPVNLLDLGAPTTNVAGIYDYSFDRLRVFVGGNASAAQQYGQLYLSDYRLGETMQDVLPIVPEPTIAVLGGLGMLAFLIYRRGKN